MTAKRWLPVLGALAVVTLAGSAPGKALAQSETPPQMPPSQGTTLGDLLERALEVEPAPDAAPAPAPALQAAILQGLNKTTARVSRIEAPIGALARFGTLEITARACIKKPPTETPESAAFLEIVDVRPDSPSVTIFTGWMFASSPAISALEHPVYDVWVIDCAQIGGGGLAGQAESQEEALPAGQEPVNPQ